MPDFSQKIEFDWDQWNINKNVTKHNVSNQECERAFGDQNAAVMADEKHSTKEPRFILLAKTLNNRYLTTIFTYRENKVRVISSRNMNKEERRTYESKEV